MLRTEGPEAIGLSQLSIQESDLIDEAALDHQQNPTPNRTVSQTNPIVKDSTCDDLIPSGDPSHQNLKLRNLSVDLLQRLTARTILSFVLSLLEDEDLIGFSTTTTRESIIRSVLKNRDSFARLSRSETQIIIAESLLVARSRIVSEYEDETTAQYELPGSEEKSTLEERLEERRVSGVVEEQLKELIKNQFTIYEHPFRNPTNHSPLKSSISLTEASSLISFSAQVLSWNRLFDLVLSTSG